MLQKLKILVDLLTLRDFPESLAYFDVTDNGSAGCNVLIVRVSRCHEYLCFCYGFFSEPHKRSVRPDHNNSCHSIAMCSQTERDMTEKSGSSSFDSASGCSINGSKQACKLR